VRCARIPIALLACAAIVVWVHGGGWVGGRRADTYPDVQREVELGRVAVASVDYRVAPRYPSPSLWRT